MSTARRLAVLAPFAAVFAVWALALPVDPMDVDAAEYAHIAREMLDSGSFLAVKNRGYDYLDKPPLTFWLTALAYAAFGVSAATSKLASLAAAVVATWSTHRLVRLDATPRAAFLAALFLASSQALFLVTNDCRTDTVLLGAVAFALWQLRAHQLDGRWRSLVLGGLGVGLAMLAKGPIGAAVPVFAVGAEHVLSRQWRRLASWRHLAVGAVALAVLTPMLIGLHRQYGFEGWRFFFWTQSFGRITGSNIWRDDTGPLFFTHTMLWAFLPWTPMLVPAVLQAVVRLVRGRLRATGPGEGFLVGGLLLTFVALSASQYKLPHYIFVGLPFAAALSGRWTDAALDGPRAPARLRVAGLVVAALVWGLAGALVFVAFPLPFGAVALAALGLLGATVFAAVRAPTLPSRVLAPPFAAILGLNVLLAGHVYPALLAYQSGSSAVHLAQARGLPEGRIGAYRAREYSLDFSVRRDLAEYHRLEEVAAEVARAPLWLYTDTEGLDALRTAPVALGTAFALPEYHVTRLAGRFLWPATRAQLLSTRYLVEVRSVTRAP